MTVRRRGNTCEYVDSMADLMMCYLEVGMDSLKEGALSVVDSILDEVVDVLDDLVEGIEGVIEGLIDSVITPLASKIESIFDGIFGVIDDAVSEISSFVDRAYDRVLAAVDDAINSISSTLGVLIDSFVDQMESVIGRVDSVIESVEDNFDTLVETALIEIEELTVGVSESIEGVINELSEGVDELLTGVEKSVTDMIDSVTVKLDDIVTGVGLQVEALIDEAVESVDVVVESLGESIDRVVNAIADFTETVGLSTDTVLNSLLNLLGFPFGIANTAANADALDGLKGDVDSLFEAITNPSDSMVSTLKGLSSREGGPSLWGRVIFQFVSLYVAGVSLAQAGQIINQPRSIRMLQEVMSEQPVTNFTAGESVAMAVKRVISDDEAVDNNLKEGYEKSKTDKLIEAGKHDLDIERGLVLLRRGEISEEDFVAALRHAGLKEKAIDAVITLRDLIPGPSDLVSMAVRDAFSDESISEFGTDAEFPEEFGKWANELGYSDYWSRKYWIAHWRLPSATQGFEMFHRRVIDRSELDLLLKMLDVSPFWRDRLTQIAYQPITRVDIRRIYKLGLMDESEVYDRHLDIGYSPNDAEKMTQFVRFSTDDPIADDGIDIRGLTASQIKKLWQLGTIDSEAAVSRLTDIKYSLDVAKLMVQSWADDVVFKERESLIKRVIRNAVRDGLDDRSIQDLITDLNLTNDEYERILREVYLESRDYDSLPSKSETRAMLKAGIITWDQASETLRRMGYNAFWIDKYRQYWSK